MKYICMVLIGAFLATAANAQEVNPPAQALAKQRAEMRERLQKQREEMAAAFSKTRTAAAMEKAAADRKYLFVFFKTEDNDDTADKLKAFQDETAKLGQVAQTVVVDLSAVSEQPTLTKYGLARAPMPLVLAIAPNGAITGGIPYRVTQDMLKGAMVSKFEQECLAALQDGKILFICAQDKTTSFNDEAMVGVNEFIHTMDHIVKPKAIKVAPGDKDARAFLNKIGVPEKLEEATTIILAPPARLQGKFEGPTTKEQIQGAFAGGGCC